MIAIEKVIMTIKIKGSYSECEKIQQAFLDFAYKDRKYPKIIPLKISSSTQYGKAELILTYERRDLITVEKFLEVYFNESK